MASKDGRAEDAAPAQAGTGISLNAGRVPQQRRTLQPRAVSGEAPTTPQPSVIASNLRPVSRNTLVGVVGLTVVKWRFTFRGCLHHGKGDREWISFPAREWIAQDRTKKMPTSAASTTVMTRCGFNGPPSTRSIELPEGREAMIPLDGVRAYADRAFR